MATNSAFLRSVDPIPSSDREADRIAYSRDLWPRHLIDVRRGKVAPAAPELVVWPRTTEEVASVVRSAHQEGVQIVPYGAGSGVCGAIAAKQSVVVDMKRLADWRIDAEAPLLDVGPGAMGITLEEDIQARGYTVGHFPSSILCSTVGGWIAGRGAGQCSGLYGKIEDMVAELECVLGDGEVVRLKRRQNGIDLSPLFIGSEGTLGIITRAKLRLHSAPRGRGFAAFSYRTTEAGWEAMRELFQAGLRPAVCRLYDPIDSFMLKQGAVKKPRAAGYRKATSGPLSQGNGVLKRLLTQPRLLNGMIKAAEGNVIGGATLVLVFEGSVEDTQADVERARQVCQRVAGKSLGEGPARAWLEHRYSVSYRQAPVFRMGAFSDTMEVSAPWSRLGALYDGVREALGRYVLVMAHLSHAYPDGCSIYFTFSGIADSDEAALEKYDRAWRAALDAAIDAGGSLSHHHGVGRSKAPRLGRELGIGVDVVRRLQTVCDPGGILNPGALIPREIGGGDQALAERVGIVPTGLDEHSLLYTARGETSLEQISRELGARGFELCLSGEVASGTTVKDWIAGGLEGAPDRWADPVQQAVAGFVASLASGERLVVRPAPRRAVGPDLFSLLAGGKERVGVIEQATLRIQRAGQAPARELPFDHERNSGLSEGESRLFERLAQAATVA